MEILQEPEGDVVAEHSASIATRIWAVVLLILPGAGFIFAVTQSPGNEAATPLAAIGAVLLILGGLAVVQQNKSRVVLRADGVERWGLRGKLWALRWNDMTELHYGVVKVRLGGLLGML